MSTTSASVIGEGSYGCVHKPQLQCNTQKHKPKNTVSKFMFTEDALKELSEYANISHIDKRKKFYLGKPFKCKMKKTKYNYNSIKKCDLYNETYNSHKKYSRKKKKDTFSKFSLLVVPFGGMDISKFANSLSRDSLNIRKHKLDLFWKHALHILKGIQLFQSHGFLHHDIKPQNIVFNVKNNQLRFIDFGFMTKIKEVIELCEKNKYFIAKYPFWSFPIEFPYLNKNAYMRIAQLSHKEKYEYFENLLRKMKDKHSKISISFHIFFDHVMNNYNEIKRQEMINKYFKDFMNFIEYEIEPKNYEVFLEKSIKTIDLFGVGMTLQYILSYSTDYFDSKKISDLEECFFNMMRPSVMYRYTIEEAIDTFTQIIESKSVDNSFPFIESIDIPDIKNLNQKNSEQLIIEQEKILDSLHH